MVLSSIGSGLGRLGSHFSRGGGEVEASWESWPTLTLTTGYTFVTVSSVSYQLHHS